MNSPTLDAFMGYGIEIEYAIVDSTTLTIRPMADRLLAEAAGAADVSEVDRGLLGWSNELVLHVIEIKNQRPAASLDHLPSAFQSEIRHINQLLARSGARLMPTAMHPWMQPDSETRLWPHDNAGIYQAYARLFDTATHGWANLQSMHINLPFADDRQFARLHAAARLVLPIIPALAASSPVAAGHCTGFADNRMEVYRTNARQYPSITGRVIPDTVSSRAEYEARILAPMYREIAAWDPDRVLQHEWLNSRGAIARFDRNALEIRVVDTQENPTADLAIAAAIISAVQMLYRGDAASLSAQQALSTETLAAILSACIRTADKAVIDHADYLTLFGYPAARCSAIDLWRHLARQMERSDMLPVRAWRPLLEVILEQGPLARRILRALGDDYSRPRLEAVYRRLCDCLAEGTMFIPSALPRQ